MHHELATRAPKPRAPRKAPEAWQLEDAERLRALYARKRDRLSQAEFGATFGIGNQAAVWQFLSGRIPLSEEAAAGFARGLGVTVDAFSPRLAASILEKAKLVSGFLPLPAEEMALLEKFRGADQHGRAIIQATATAARETMAKYKVGTQ